MSATKLIISVVWALGVTVVAFLSLADYFENLYRARVAVGGELSPMDLGFKLYAICLGIGLVGFALGLLGKLPGTGKRRKINT